jgi:hypothetical protein
VSAPAVQAPPAQARPAPPQQQAPPSDDHLIALTVAALATYWTAQALMSALRAPFKAAGISGQALSAATALVLSWPQEAMEGTGPAQRWAVRANLVRRAGFLLNAGRRVQAALIAARSQNLPARGAIAGALAAEKRYLAQHVAASTGRVAAATAVDGMAAVHGNLLGWQALKDKRCTPGCAAASGRNFRADRPPVVEGYPAYPGTVHGATCRCRPVAPFRGAALLPAAGDSARSLTTAA